jgi:hypothetical protein
MASVEQILQQEINPFDPTTYKIFSFWDEQNDKTPIVDSIHKDVVHQVEATLNQVIQDHVSRSLIIAGDSGSGKSVLLNRLKEQFNKKAFFAYIGAWPDNNYIWRHTLRQVIDSLLQIPEGESESQLILWLKGLSAFSEQGLQKWILGERKLFIRNLQLTYPVGIYNAKEFFGILYDLTNPELRPTACEWLKGDDLDEEDLHTLRVRQSINSEDAAQKILTNFGKISRQTYPIVLCFDNLDNVPMLPSKIPDFQPLFNVNTTIHSQKFKNFLTIVSLVTNDLKENLKYIQQADKASIYKWLSLKSIDLNQAEELWASRLYPIHQQATPKPESPIYPLTRQHLEKAFPGGRANPRSVMQVGYKFLSSISTDSDPVSTGSASTEVSVSTEPQIEAAFKLLWGKEIKEVQKKINRVRYFSPLELVAMLQRAMAAIQVENIQPKLLSSKTYSSYSFGYSLPKKSGKVGIIWTEEPNMTSFFHIMNACQKAIDSNICKKLYLIRAEGFGKTTARGYQIFKRIFQTPPHSHIVPDLNALHYLATYDRLANSANSGELVITDKIINLSQLQELVRKTEILHDCSLLQALGVVPVKKKDGKDNDRDLELEKLKRFVFDFITQHKLVARKVIDKHAQNQFAQLSDAQIQQVLQELIQARQIRILDDKPSTPNQIICWIPKGNIS